MALADIHRAPGAPEDAPGAELVRGSYDFYHFGCQGLDDRGWGCAYRSLQTIASWALRAEGGPAGPPPVVPSHREVQEALERCGDKPAGFAGPREWVGSFELGLALDALLGVPSRIPPFNCGSELSSAAAALERHFARGGGPGMCGGGLAAVTILGVAPGPAPRTLVLDAHFYSSGGLAASSAAEVAAAGCLTWRRLDDIAPQGAHCNLLLPSRGP